MSVARAGSEGWFVRNGTITGFIVPGLLQTESTIALSSAKGTMRLEPVPELP